jgi:hypothetical protein
MRPTARTVTPGTQSRQASTFPAANPYTPAIPQPSENLSNLASCVSALKESVESLTGQRGEASNRAATFNDLVFFGLLTPEAINSPTGGVEILALKVSNILIKESTFVLLPAGVVGMIVQIIDSPTDVWGDAIVTGGGPYRVLAWYNSVNWMVMAK